MGLQELAKWLEEWMPLVSPSTTRNHVQRSITPKLEKQLRAARCVLEVAEDDHLRLQKQAESELAGALEVARRNLHAAKRAEAQ